MTPIVSVLIVCYNKLDYTRRCIAALRQNTDPAQYEIIVVDNASSDATPQFLANLAQEMPNLKTIRAEENLGFVVGNNRGAEAAVGRYLFFLNNDTEVQPGWLEPLIETIEADAMIGVAGSKLIYPNGSLQEAGGMIFRDGSGWNFGKLGDPHDPEYNYVREVDYCSGAALMIRTDLFELIGGFDTLFAPAYWEDADLCFAVRKAGYRVLYQPRSVIVHHEGITAGTNVSSGIKRYQTINRPHFMSKWVYEMTEQPTPPPDMKTGRRLSDRRCRDGKQILIIADGRQGAAKPEDRILFELIGRLLDMQQHVTYVFHPMLQPSTAAAQPGIDQLRNKGVLVYPFDGLLLEGNTTTAEALLIEILQRRDYDVALLTDTQVTDHVAEQIRRHSPLTRIIRAEDRSADLLVDSILQNETGISGTGSSIDKAVQTYRGGIQSAEGSVARIELDNLANYPNLGVTLGQGFYQDEGGWRWMAQVGQVFVWSEALSLPRVLSFELACDEAEWYAPFPFEVRVSLRQEQLVLAIFHTSHQKQLFRVRLKPSDSDICLLIQSTSAFMPASADAGADQRTLSVRLSNLHLTA